jgi:uncharacterized membrane protein
VRTILWLHVAGGGLSLLAGFAALSTAKGAQRHRSLGRVFVYAMLTMALSGVGIAAVTGVETSVVMGTLAAYLVITGLTAVSPPATGPRWISLVGAGVAFALAVALTDLGRRAVASPDGVVEGLPAPMAFIFAVVAALAGVSDIRLLTGPPLRGGKKLRRHLWRMCVALFIAAASFFLGQPNAIPPPLRIPALLAVPVVTPLLVMAFWLWRTRTRRIAAPEAPQSDADAAWQES